MVSASIPADELAMCIEIARQWAHGRSVPWVTGSLSAGQLLATVRFEADGAALQQTQAFLEVIEPLDVRLLVAGTAVLVESVYQNALAKLEENGASEEYLEKARSCKRHIGRTAAFDLAALVGVPPVALELGVDEDWFTLMWGVEDNVGQRGAGVDEEWERHQEERRAWTARRRTAAARAAAQDERFSAAKTEAARVHLLRLIHGDDLPEDEFLLKEMAREAKGIFDLEYRRR